MGCTAASLVQRGMGLKGESETLWEWVDHRKDGDQHGRIKAVNDWADRGILGRERAGVGAMIVDKYAAKPEPAGLPIALRSTATTFGEVKMENASGMQNAKTGAAPSSYVKSGAT